MSRAKFGGPQLPKALQDQIGGAPKKRKQFAPRRPPQRSQSSVTRPQNSQQLRKPVSKVKAVRKVISAASSSEEDHEEDLSELEAEEPRRSASPVISKRAAKAGLADNDAEIAALERKLGRRGKEKRSANDSDDDLGFLLGSESEGDESGSLKRKRPDDAEWLRDKRQKAHGEKASRGNGERGRDTLDEMDMESDDDMEDDDDGLENPFSDDELSESDFDGFAEEAVAKTPRENPYVAPVSRDAAAATKYVPPSLRKAAVSDEEALRQLRKQIQGQLNRLSEANILSILQAIELIYEKNARQHVTSTLIDLLVSLVADPSTLNDTFLILHAGFSAAVYKVAGTDFGAQLLERVVEAFDKARDGTSEGKEMLNILAFLANLYQFQVVGSGIVFDYVRLLLDDLSETSTELLLRIVRTSGMQLRQEDPTALKDIVLLLHRNTARVGEENLSVRTKFMIETINNLKNNRMKTGQGASALAAEHTARMKKSLGLVKTRSFKSTEPLRITLADIRDTEKKGKWWLVGASYNDPAKHTQNDAATTTALSTDKTNKADPAYDSETGLPDLSQLARAQGMNTDIRRAIFVTVLSAADVDDAHTRLLKLNLKAKQQFEIPRVLLHCVGAEPTYNPYYARLARKFCSEHRLRKAWQFALWDLFRRMGEQAENDDDDDDHDNHPSSTSELTIPKLVNLAKLYGTLIASDGLRVTLLRILDFARLREKTGMFVEVLLTTALTQVRRRGEKSEVEARTRTVFGHAHGAREMVTGLKWFVGAVVSTADLAQGKKEVRAVREGCAVAIAALTDTPVVAGGARAESDDGSSDY